MEKTEILAMLNEKYDVIIFRRLDKLVEEVEELLEAAHNKNIFDSKENMDDFIDELADVNVIVFHIAGILGLTQDKLIDMAVDKIKGREKDPNYKRKHPHQERN